MNCYIARQILLTTDQLYRWYIEKYADTVKPEYRLTKDQFMAQFLRARRDDGFIDYESQMARDFGLDGLTGEGHFVYGDWYALDGYTIEETEAPADMKEIMLSINPEWTRLIFTGEKKVEIRKRVPKALPFKVFIYETIKGGGAGAVVGEFNCDTIIEFGTIEEAARLGSIDLDRLEDYAQGAQLYGLPITDLIKYPVPRPISDYRRDFDKVVPFRRAPQSWEYCRGKINKAD